MKTENVLSFSYIGLFIGGIAVGVGIVDTYENNGTTIIDIILCCGLGIPGIILLFGLYKKLKIIEKKVKGIDV